MSLTAVSRENLKNEIINYVTARLLNSSSINKLALKYNVSRQSVYKTISKLCEEGVIKKTKNGNELKYTMDYKVESFCFKLKNAKEDLIYKQVEPFAKKFNTNIQKMYSYVFTEMVNNAIDHSQGENLLIEIRVNNYELITYVYDDGIGVFKNIQEKFHLDELSHAVLELAKGKTTTDPEHHTGEGIFFSSKMADEFAIVANGLTYVTTNISFSNELFDNSNNSKEFLYDDLKIDDGTYVYFKFNAHNQFQMAKKFNEFADGNGFYKTIVPVKHLEENSQDVFYISRSQAKRLTAGFEKFKSVILDFNDVKEIGQAFADEVFRVYQNAHQTTKISFINANKNVKKMIERVKNNSIEKN